MGEMGNNRPDCAYFLLLGLCGAAFLLTIGGILTYIAFNPGAIDNHPHSALSHIPHFHHHKHHPAPTANNNHHHYPQHDPSSSHQPNQAHQTHHTTTSSDHRNPAHSNSEESSNKNKSTSPSGPLQHQEETSPKKNSSSGDSPGGHHTSTPPPFHRNASHNVQDVHAHPGSSSEAYDSKAKQSLALAIIGPLCLLMGIVVTLIVGVLALRYDCDHEPEPNIAFLRLRSEMSLNFDGDKNNYELLRASSSIDQAGGQYSINPTGLPRC